MSSEPSWPYEKIEERKNTSDPSWECPDEKCSCNEQEEEAEKCELSVMLCNPEGKRLGGARCRVVANGQLANPDDPFADGEGWITVELRRSPETVWVEWAPSHTPVEPGLPYRRRYYVNLCEEDEPESMRRRLHNLGFSFLSTLRENIQDFQYTYDYPELTGEIDDIRDDLIDFHDHAMVPKTKQPARDKLEDQSGVTKEERGSSQDDDSPFQLASFGPRADPGGGGGGGDGNPPKKPAPKQNPPGGPASKGNAKAGGGAGTGTLKLSLSPDVKRLRLLDTMDAREEDYHFYPVKTTTKFKDKKDKTKEISITGTFWVFFDALTNKNRTWLRLPCCAAEAEVAAQRIKVAPKKLHKWDNPPDEPENRSFFMTPKLMDLRWIEIEKTKTAINPCPKDINAPIYLTSQSMNRCVEKQIPSPLDPVGDPGKIWAVSNRLGDKIENGERAINYGWHADPKWQGAPLYTAVTPSLKVAQPEGGTHNAYHIDYSQILLLVAGWCLIENPTGSTPKAMKTDKVYTDENLSKLVTHDGPLKHPKQPFTEKQMNEEMEKFWQKEEAKYRRDRIIEENKRKADEEKKKKKDDEKKKKEDEAKKKAQEAKTKA